MANRRSTSAGAGGSATVPSAPRLPDVLAPFADRAADDGWVRVAVDHWPTGSPLDLSEIVEARLTDLTLSGADLGGCRVRDVIIVGGHWSAVNFAAASLTRVRFSACRMSSLDLSGATLRDVRFVDCKMDALNARQMRGVDVRFDSCVLTTADFGGADLDNIAWFDCDLEGAEFGQANVRGAQLHGSRLDGLRGATRLRPATIDAHQAPLFAEFVLAELRIAVGPRRDGTPEP